MTIQNRKLLHTSVILLENIGGHLDNTSSINCSRNIHEVPPKNNNSSKCHLSIGLAEIWYYWEIWYRRVNINFEKLASLKPEPLIMWIVITWSSNEGIVIIMNLFRSMNLVQVLFVKVSASFLVFSLVATCTYSY